MNTDKGLILFRIYMLSYSSLITEFGKNIEYTQKKTTNTGKHIFKADFHCARSTWRYEWHLAAKNEVYPLTNGWDTLK